MADLMRLSGINSGYDTEAMIEKMMQTYQTKIDNQNKKLTKLQWQQEAYRDITSKLTAFKNKYFDILNRESYLMSPTAFSKFNSTITNKTNSDKTSGISVTTTSGSKEADYSLKVLQTATATTLTGKSITPSSFNLDLSKAASSSDYTLGADGVSRDYNFALDVKVGDVTRTIEFSVNVAQDASGAIDQDAFNSAVSSALNAEFDKEFGVTGKKDGSGNDIYFLQTKVGADNTLEFEVGGNSTVTVTEKTGNFGLARPNYRQAIATQSAVTGKNTVAVNVNGVTKNVSFQGVSSTYFDSRNEAGNGKILAEYNELKAAAYRKANNLPDSANVSSEQLDSFSYTSTQAAKDKNAAALISALDSSFSEQGLSFKIDGNGYLMATKGSVAQDFTITAVAGGTLGLAKGTASNKFASGTTLKEMGIVGLDETVKFKINGKEISVSGRSTMDDLVAAVNKSNAGVTMAYSKLENKFVITANDLGNGGDVEVEANEFTAKLGLADSATTASQAVIGQNAIFELDGVEIYHNSNSYSIDGTTLEFKDAEIGSEYKIGVAKSYDDVKQTIKDFVKDYNQLIDDIYGHIGTAPARDSKNNKYDPLTDAQKEDMSEKEIEKWEDAAKKGVIYGDPTVSGIMSKIRTALYNAVTLDDGSKFGLYSMGIKTKAYKEDAHGKLEIDEDAFDKAFNENPDAIMKLFTDPNAGRIMKQVNTVIDNAVRTTGQVKGSLIRKAGLESGSTAKDNAIYKQMEQINKRIATLQDRYTAKEDYWWSVFTNLEKMMSNLNSQSSYMAGFLNNFGSNQQ